MMRRKTTPTANGGPAGYGVGVQYGAPNYGDQSGGSYSQQGGGGGGGGGGYSGGGSSYGSNNGSGGGYSGYGSSNQGYGGSGSGGFGVPSGGSYSDPPLYGSAGRSSLKGHKSKAAVPFSLKFLMDKFVIAIVMSVIFFMSTMYYRALHSKLLSTFHVQSIVDAVKSYEKFEAEKIRYQKDSNLVQEQARSLKESIRSLEKQNRDLRKQMDDVKLKASSGGLSLDEMEKLKAREEAWKKQVTVLQAATQRESKRAVEERFGPGPHHVLFTISIPGDEAHSTFKVELAPLDMMPHANHLFLQQVYHELWDNTWIYLNGPHVLQAGPQDWEEDSAGESLKRFTDTKLDALAFPEYSVDFPHKPWTMGFTGRPGGPDWYINKADNTIPHGPGGQSQHSLEEQADACFAKVVEGMDVLQRIYAAKTYPRGDPYAYFFEDPIEIVTARILEPVHDAVQKAKPHEVPQAAAKKTVKKPQRVNVNQEVMDEAKGDRQDNNAPAP